MARILYVHELNTNKWGKLPWHLQNVSRLKIEICMDNDIKSRQMEIYIKIQEGKINFSMSRSIIINKKCSIP